MRLAVSVVPPLLAGVFACSGGAAFSPVDPPEPAFGPLAIQVIYPPPARVGHRVVDGSTIVAAPSYRIPAVDSLFVFGSVGRGDARLTVNGREVPVYPTGGWIAWLPVPEDTLVRIRINAVAGGQLATAVLEARRVPEFRPAWAAGPWLDPYSIRPQGDHWVRPGEGYRLSVRASPGATVRAILATGDTVQLLASRERAPLSWGERAFGTDPADRPPVGEDQYAGWWTGAMGPNPGHVMRPLWETAQNHPDWAQIEVITAGDTLRRPWPVRVGVIDSPAPPLVIVEDDTAGTGATDNTLPGRLTPNGTYHWFFPNGTVARVSGRRNDQVRLQLSATSVAWVDAQDVHPLPQGMPPPVGVSRPPRLYSDSASVTLRVPLPGRIPFRVDETAREVRLRVYGVAPDIDWIQYGGTDPFVELVTFEQATEDEVVFVVRLAEPVWGYRTRWVADDLLLEIRRPPSIDPDHPVRGRLVAIDAGHPPGGAIGPTGVTEPSVTLAVSRLLRDMLERAGAEVLMVRDAERPVDLVERVRLAEQANADLLVSIHANALPDGVNPFTNSGTSVYYYHPRSAPLARALNETLVAQFGERDLGFGRGDLAVVRTTWMPSALTEGLFLMLPDQEAILSSHEGQLRYATGVMNGIQRFLGERAESSR